MKIINFIFSLALMVMIYSCSKIPKANDDLRSVMVDEKFALKGDSLRQFNAILDKLDDKNEPLKNFVYHTFYEIQDSMDLVMPHAIYDTLSDKDREVFAEKKANLTIATIKQYQKRLNITEKDEGIIQYAFVLDPTVKSFCRNYVEKVSKGKISF